MPLLRFEPLRRAVLERAGELGVGYRGSSLVGEARTRRHASDAAAPGLVDRIRFACGPRPGDRAPDARGRDAAARPVRLFDRFRGPHATLLLFAGVRPAAHLHDLADRCVAAVGDGIGVCVVVAAGRVPAGLPVGRVLLDPDGEAHRLYGATAEALYLVRPDGYIGFRGQPADTAALLDHLRAVFGENRMPAAPAEPGNVAGAVVVPGRPPSPDDRPLPRQEESWHRPSTS